MFSVQMDFEEMKVVVEALKMRVGSLESELQFIAENLASSRTNDDIEMWLDMQRSRQHQVRELARVLKRIESEA